MTLDSPDLLNTMSREMAAEFKGECGGAMPSTFVGRQMTVQGRDGSYIGCGSVAGYMPGVTDAIAILNKHYYYNGNLNPRALIHVNENNARLQITAVISGLPVNEDVEIHINSGFECPGPDKVLSMLYPASQQPDLTTIQTGNSLFVLRPETADILGNIFFQANSFNSELKSTTLSFLAGRVITIQHKTSGALVCGTIEPTTMLVVPVVPSATAAPSAPSSVDMSVVRGGLIMAAQAGSGVALRGTVLMSAARAIEAPCLINFKSKNCEGTENLFPEISLDRINGVCQLTQHELNVSIDPFAAGDGASLRGAAVTVSNGAEAPICGRLAGPLSEVPTPDPKMCSESDGLRGASIGFIVLSTISLLLLTALYIILRADATEKTVIQVSTKVVKKIDAARTVSTGKVETAKKHISSVRHAVRNSVHTHRSVHHSVNGPKAGARVHLLGAEAADIDTTPDVVMVRNHSQKFQLKANGLADPTKTRKPRLLALHGTGSNKDVTKRQLRNLGITEELFTIFFLNGPVKEAQEGPGLEGLFEGPFYSWFDKKAMNKDTVLEMLGSVVMFIKNNNIDGLFGFSQGGVVASAIMQPEVRELLCSYLGVQLRSEQQRYNANFNLSFSMLAHSASSELVRSTLGLEPQAAPNSINGHSIHLIGISDPGKPKSEAEALVFEGGATRLIVYHAGAHELPRELETNELLYIRVMTHIGESLRPKTQTSLGVGAKVFKFKNRLRSSLSREKPASILEKPQRAFAEEEPFPPSLPPSPPLASAASNDALSIDGATETSSRRESSRVDRNTERIVETAVAAASDVAAIVGRALVPAGQGTDQPPRVRRTTKESFLRRTTKESLLVTTNETALPVRMRRTTKDTMIDAFAAGKEVTFPKGFIGTPGAVYSIKQADGEETFVADHLVVPTTADTLPWQTISKYSSVSVSPLQQLVRVKISPEADNYPCTLRGLLTAQPYDAPCIRTASNPNIALTYGQLHSFMAPGEPVLH